MPLRVLRSRDEPLFMALPPPPGPLCSSGRIAITVTESKGKRVRILVTGGAGYIGGVVSQALLQAGHSVWVLDSLQNGHREAVPREASLVVSNVADQARVESVLREERIEAVIHMAGSIEVGESVRNPGHYWRNNLAAGLSLLGGMVDTGVSRLVFSSTAAVYGEPVRIPIDEDDPTVPTNPYGETKLAFERALCGYGRAHGLRSARLRYFNAAGATETHGEAHHPETHLIPRILAVAAGGERAVSLYGTDHPTRDGTCVRDYVHVADLAQAHLLALARLEEEETIVYNVGCGGRGHTVLEVIEAARRVTGRAIPVEVSPRRPGDAAVLLASPARIQRDLGWIPRYGALEDILATAWEWKARFPRGW